MKKKLLVFVAVFAFCLIVPAVFMVGCKSHQHQYSSEWSSNDMMHWHACTHKDCQSQQDLAKHEYDNGFDEECNVCGYKRSPSENTVEFNIDSRIYNSHPQPLLDFEWAAQGEGEVVIKYKPAGANDSAYSTTAPTNAGEYDVMVSTNGDAQYGPASGTTTMTIKKRPLYNVDVVKVYDGSVQTTQRLDDRNGVIANDIVNITITTNADYTIGNTGYVNCGTKTIVSATIDNDNYLLETSSTTYTIVKADLDITFENADEFKSGIYVNSTWPEISVTTNFVGDPQDQSSMSVGYEMLINGVWQTVEQSYAVSNAGYCRMTITFAESTNYNQSSISIKFDVLAN